MDIEEEKKKKWKKSSRSWSQQRISLSPTNSSPNPSLFSRDHSSSSYWNKEDSSRWWKSAMIWMKMMSWRWRKMCTLAIKRSSLRMVEDTSSAPRSQLATSWIITKTHTSLPPRSSSKTENRKCLAQHWQPCLQTCLRVTKRARILSSLTTSITFSSTCQCCLTQQKRKMRHRLQDRQLWQFWKTSA